MSRAGGVTTNPIDMLKWSIDWMARDNKIWIYPVLLSLISGLLIYALSIVFLPAAILLPFAIFVWWLIVLVVNLLIQLVIYVLMVISGKMFLQAFTEGSTDFERAKREVQSAIGAYIVVGIIAVILGALIITAPLGIMLVVYSILYDPSRIAENLERGFRAIIDNLAHVLIFIIISIVAGALLSLSGSLLSILTNPLSTFLNIAVLGAFVYLAAEYEGLGGEEAGPEEV